MTKLQGQPVSSVNSPSASRASTEEVETPKKRGRKPGSKNEKRKAEDGEDEPPAKKRRGPQGRPKAVLPVANGGASGMSRENRVVLQKSLRLLYDGLMGLEDEPEPRNDDESEPEKTLIIGPFIKLPPKRDYADYYLIIQNPICMKDIDRKIKKEEYGSLGDMKRDIDLMIRNCRTYNEDGSSLWQWAGMMEVSLWYPVKQGRMWLLMHSIGLLPTADECGTRHPPRAPRLRTGRIRARFGCSIRERLNSPAHTSACSCPDHED
jgi:ATP-dependent helicase STH1/SNF2